MARGPSRIVVRCEVCHHVWHGTEVDATIAGWEKMPRKGGHSDWRCAAHRHQGSPATAGLTTAGLDLGKKRD